MSEILTWSCGCEYDEKYHRVSACEHHSTSVQCAARTTGGTQCLNSARHDTDEGKVCAIHYKRLTGQSPVGRRCPACAANADKLDAARELAESVELLEQQFGITLPSKFGILARKILEG